MRVRPADAEDGMSLSVPEDCEVVVPVVGVRLGVFFWQESFSEQERPQGRTAPDVAWAGMTGAGSLE